MKLGFESKGEMQAHYFGQLVTKYFEGGNAQGQGKSVANDIISIVIGLSNAWDRAEEESVSENKNL